MHTPLCRHASGEPTEYAAHALSVGLTEIGFTDHSPMRQDDF
ncbi:MAG: Histidinol phosphate phosphatase, partial [Verrucomicrobiales bacterium]|nr:Histidinol phosphate phosphatase [Verrucomicrobiales bacterium]